jgi:DNA-binding HxlR family transcriptional regulator
MIKMPPQIRCPKCGMTLNLKNRREIDFYLIKKAVEKQPKSFTELLRSTHLPRKTLNLRLKELCNKRLIIKGEGLYKLNSSYNFKSSTEKISKGIMEIYQNGKRRMAILIVTLLLMASTSGYALSMLIATPPQLPTEKSILGKFNMLIKVNNVNDLYGWQVLIVYNSSEMKVIETNPGNFCGDQFPSLTIDIIRGIFVNASDIGEGKLLVGGCLIGNVPGRSGTGILANITFGYYEKNYTKPEIVINSHPKTMLIDSSSFLIPVEEILTFDIQR